MMEPIIELIERQTRAYAEEIDRTIMRAVTDVGVQVDQERLLQALNDARQFWYEGYNAALREQEQSRWISVKERLPKRRADYLCIYVFGDSEMHFYGVLMFHPEQDAENGYVTGPHFSDEGMEGMRVTHWMPLPEPPKEGAEG